MIEIDHAIEQRDFNEARRGRGHFDLPMGLSDHIGAEHLLNVALDAVDIARRLFLPVDLERGEAFGQLALGRTDASLENVRGRVGGIGRHQQHALPAPAGGQRECRRAGRLADAALATEEDDLAVQEAGQQHGRLPIGECSIPIRRCHWWNCSRR